MPAPLLSDTRILLVEDDAAIRATLADLLREEGSNVTATPHGRAALAELRGTAPPDVILLDLMMPVMDGWEFRVEQRSDPILATIPVIAMSADISAKARAIAADAYVRKPVDFSELTRRIRSVVDHAANKRGAVADRMAALSTLAAGIAHEINNPLTYVMANLQVLQERLPGLSVASGDAGELRDLLTDAMEGVERIRRIVKQAQLVAPAQLDSHATNVDLADAVDAALTVAGDQIRRRARLVRQADSRPLVHGDRGRIEQLLVNLLVNAAQAIPDDAAPDAHEVRVTLEALPSGRALVEIADTGHGIPPDVQERIFQPFFTTRPIGQGTGLGLSICRGIVTALGGEIAFQSEVGRGTVFRVLIPMIELSAVGRGQLDLPPRRSTSAT